jgi:hypothetical protein
MPHKHTNNPHKTAALNQLQVRVAVADSYVILFARLGATWVEKNINRVVTVLLQLHNQKVHCGMPPSIACLWSQ